MLETISCKAFKPAKLGDATILIPEPDVVPRRPFVGRDELVTRCMAAWLDVDRNRPLHFRLTGPPGVGKNELVYHLAHEALKRPLYIMHGHEELTPEDIACTARIATDNRIEYVGSPLLAAMLHGGICFFDEIGKVPSRSLSLLASVLDERRTLTSVLAGFSVPAQPGFRFCAAMNEADAATGGLPGYIDERLRPAFKLDQPPIGELMRIVETGVADLNRVLLERFGEWMRKRLSKSHRQTSPRESLTLLGLAERLHQFRGGGTLTPEMADELIQDAARDVCDDDAN